MIVDIGLFYGVCLDVCIPVDAHLRQPIAEGTTAGTEAIRAGLEARARTAAEAGLANARCRIAPDGDGFAVSATLSFATKAPKPQAVVFETGSDDIQISPRSVHAEGRDLNVEAELYNWGKGPLSLDRSALRVTLIDDSGATEIRGLPGGLTYPTRRLRQGQCTQDHRHHEHQDQSHSQRGKREHGIGQGHAPQRLERRPQAAPRSTRCPTVAASTPPDSTSDNASTAVTPFDSPAQHPAPERTHHPPHILLRGDQRRHDQQHQEHPRPQPVGQRDHRGFQELRLLAGLVQERRQPQHRRKRRKQDRPQPVTGRIHDRRHQPALFRVFVDGGDQHDAVVDDDPRHPDQPRPR